MPMFRILFVASILGLIAVRAFNAQVDFADASSIVSWLCRVPSSAEGEYWLAALILAGGFVGTASGTPTPVFEGFSLATCIHWVPGLIAQSAGGIKQIIVIIAAIWLAAFVSMVTRFVFSENLWISWGALSPIALLTRPDRLDHDKDGICT